MAVVGQATRIIRSVSSRPPAHGELFIRWCPRSCLHKNTESAGVPALCTRICLCTKSLTYGVFVAAFVLLVAADGRRPIVPADYRSSSAPRVASVAPNGRRCAVGSAERARRIDPNLLSTPAPPLVVSQRRVLQRRRSSIALLHHRIQQSCPRASQSARPRLERRSGAGVRVLPATSCVFLPPKLPRKFFANVGTREKMQGHMVCGLGGGDCVVGSEKNFRVTLAYSGEKRSPYQRRSSRDLAATHDEFPSARPRSPRPTQQVEQEVGGPDSPRTPCTRTNFVMQHVVRARAHCL